MVVRIRLARFGPRHKPIYNIVVAQARSARDSLPMEVLGTYDPTPKVPLSGESAASSSSSSELEPSTADASTHPLHSAAAKPKRYKDIQLDTSRTKYWLGVGAQPSEPVWRLLSMIGLLQPKPGTKWPSAAAGSGAQTLEDLRKV